MKPQEMLLLGGQLAQWKENRVWIQEEKINVWVQILTRPSSFLINGNSKLAFESCLTDQIDEMLDVIGWGWPTKMASCVKSLEQNMWELIHWGNFSNSYIFNPVDRYVNKWMKKRTNESVSQWIHENLRNMPIVLISKVFRNWISDPENSVWYSEPVIVNEMKLYFLKFPSEHCRTDGHHDLAFHLILNGKVHPHTALSWPAPCPRYHDRSRKPTK